MQPCLATVYRQLHSPLAVVVVGRSLGLVCLKSRAQVTIIPCFSCVVTLFSCVDAMCWWHLWPTMDVKVPILLSSLWYLFCVWSQCSGNEGQRGCAPGGIINVTEVLCFLRGHGVHALFLLPFPVLPPSILTLPFLTSWFTTSLSSTSSRQQDLELKQSKPFTIVFWVSLTRLHLSKTGLIHTRLARPSHRDDTHKSRNGSKNILLQFCYVSVLLGCRLLPSRHRA